MKLDFQEVSSLLRKESVLTYRMQYLLFHSSLNPRTQLWFSDGAAMLLLDDSLHMYGDEAVLDRFLAQLESGGEYSFFGVPDKYLPLLKIHFRDIQREESCSAYTISAADFAQSIEGQDSLTGADAEFANGHWTYRHEGSLDYFTHIIATYPSSAVRIEGKLVGWAVCYDAIEDMVNLGSLRVLEQYRQQGLGRKLALDLVQKVLALGKTPMVHIVDDNIASRSLSMGIGFKPYREKIFWGQGKKK